MTEIRRRNTLKTLSAAILAPLLPAGCGGQPSNTPGIQPGKYQSAFFQLRKFILAKQLASGVVGLSVAVLYGDDDIWSDGFGFADHGEFKPVTERTIFRAGSITKMFTVARAMQLSDAGKLNIDAPLATYLPEFLIRHHDGSGPPITPRHLMTHHAGLSADQTEGMWTENPAHFTTLVNAMRDEFLAFQPGYVYAYSNLGFSLLGAVIERITGDAFEETMQKGLLLPLNMRDSSFAAAPPRGPQATAAYDDDGNPANELPLRDIPAGGLNTTAVDLLQFARLILGRGSIQGESLLASKSISEMQRPQNSQCALDFDLRVGLGWHYAPNLVRGGGPVLMHTGGTLCHRAILAILPQPGIAVAVLANTANAGEAGQAIAGQALQLVLQAETGLAPPTEKPEPKAFRIPPAPLAAFPGRYATINGTLDFKQTGKQLVVKTPGPELAAVVRPSGYLGVEYRHLGLFRADLGKLGAYEFTLNKVGKHQLLLARDDDGFYLAGEKIEPTPIPAVWIDRLGDYRYVGTDAHIASHIDQFSLAMADGYLLATTSAEDGLILALQPMDDLTAIIRGLGTGCGSSVRVIEDDQGETLIYSGMRFKKK